MDLGVLLHAWRGLLGVRILMRRPSAVHSRIIGHTCQEGSLKVESFRANPLLAE